MLDHDELTWKYRSEPDPGTNGRAILYTRGRVVGGSSSINGLVYIRPARGLRSLGTARKPWLE
jgi:choline dehydrogenase